MDEALEGTPKSEIKEVTLDTSDEGWEEQYESWQNDAVDEIRAEHGDAVETFYVGYTQVDDSPNLRSHWVYASLKEV